MELMTFKLNGFITSKVTTYMDWLFVDIGFVQFLNFCTHYVTHRSSEVMSSYGGFFNFTKKGSEVYNDFIVFIHQLSYGTENIYSVGRKIIYNGQISELCCCNVYCQLRQALTICHYCMCLNGCYANYWLDMMLRVFKYKLKELIEDICKKYIFGNVEAIFNTIWFKKVVTFHNYTADNCTEVTLKKLFLHRLTHPKLHEFV